MDKLGQCTQFGPNEIVYETLPGGDTLALDNDLGITIYTLGVTKFNMA